MLKRKSCIACLIVLLATAVLGMSRASSVAQEPPQRPTMTEEERRRITGMMLREMQKSTTLQAQAQPAPGRPQSALPSAVQRAAAAGGLVQLSFDAVELYEFVNQITSTLGITPVIIDPDIKGSVTIYSSAPMSRDDIFPLFNLILKNNNAALVQQGQVFQVVPISAALKKGLEVIEHLPPAKTEQAPAVPPKPGEAPPAQPPAAAEAKPGQAPPPVQPQVQQPPAREPAPPQQAQPEEQKPAAPRLATHVIRVEFVPVRDLIEPLKLFMTDGGVIMPYDRLNMLIVTDYSDSVSKVIEIIRLLDDSYLDADLLEVIEIKYNAAADVLEDMRKIFGSGAKDSQTGVYFVSLDRINSILVMANSKRALEEAKRWIARLDATAGRSIQTFVYTVQNATASNIAMLLSMLYGGEGGAGAAGGVAGAGAVGATRSSAGAAARDSGAVGAQTPWGGAGAGGSMFGGGYQGGYGGYGQGGFGGQFGGGFMGGSQLGPRLSQAPAMSAQVLRGGVFTGLQGDVRLVADDINNSLIIQASPADYALIIEIVDKIDVLPRQVIIDARIFEVDLTDALSFGIGADLQARIGDPRFTTAKLSGESGALSAGAFAFIGDGRELLLALSALREKTNVRVLEAPSVLALDGTPAKVVVGGEVPYPAGSYIPPTGGTTTSVQYRETGVALLIMPRISASGTVTLEIAHELSSPGASTPSGPTFNKTSVSTTLAVKDGQTVAIAGLIRQSDARSRSGIPLLSDIPLIGALFGRSTRSARRSEILIMITPHVIRTPERFQEMTQELKDSLRNAGKLMDQYQREHLEDLEKARKERSKQPAETKKPEPPPAPPVIPPNSR